MAPYALVVVANAFVFDNQCLGKAKEYLNVPVDVHLSRCFVAVCFKVELVEFLKTCLGDVFHDHVDLKPTVVPYAVLVEFWNQKFSVASFLLQAYAQVDVPKGTYVGENGVALVFGLFSHAVLDCFGSHALVG